MITADYVWIDNEKCLHSKIRTVKIPEMNIEDSFPAPDFFPKWEYDGSSLGQSSVSDSEIVLQPCFTCKCPFHKSTNGVIVLCETYKFDGTSIGSRQKAMEVLSNPKVTDEDPWFGIEQEFFMCDKKTGLPLGTPPLTSDIIRTSYCGIGAGNIFHRDIMDKFIKYASYAGLEIYGVNAEVSMGQWEYQIGTSKGIVAGDHMWVSRYIMEKIAEKYDIVINLNPKPIQFINGSGCHTNYSTKSTRDHDHGLEIIVNSYIPSLIKHHDEHILLYGKGNENRLTGKHETSSYGTFSWGYGSRDTSMRVPTRTRSNGYGYLEDRRPASNVDPYDVLYLLCKNTILQ